ncbi:hypothetical protein ACFQVC_39075 [Streptomyces monticola]|uniref:Uncharacterized protein n=1 Tax=Streptomyces monticola TaxID=2666263 RepID=A0ABW2JWX7_9ACTN
MAAPKPRAAAPKAAAPAPAPVTRPEPPAEVKAETKAEPKTESKTEVAPAAAAPRRRPRGAGKTWAHAALHESFAEAKIHSEKWRSHGFRLDREVLAQLKDRIKADRRSSGNPALGQGHYLDAALRFVPDDVDEQIAMAQEFLDERMGFVEQGKQSTYRVGEQAYGLVSTLNQALQEADYGRRGLYVVSAALERFIQALDAEGKLQRPGRRGRTGSSVTPQ